MISDVLQNSIEPKSFSVMVLLLLLFFGSYYFAWHTGVGAVCFEWSMRILNRTNVKQKHLISRNDSMGRDGLHTLAYIFIIFILLLLCLGMSRSILLFSLGISFLYMCASERAWVWVCVYVLSAIFSMIFFHSVISSLFLNKKKCRYFCFSQLSVVAFTLFVVFLANIFASKCYGEIVLGHVTYYTEKFATATTADGRIKMGKNMNFFFCM